MDVSDLCLKKEDFAGQLKQQVFDIWSKDITYNLAVFSELLKLKGRLMPLRGAGGGPVP